MARKPGRKGDLVLIEALAAGQSVAHAARLAGISVRTAFRRLDECSFQTAVRDCRNNMFEEAAGALAATTKKAAKTLENLLDDESPSIQLSAAKAVLDASQRLRETLDIEQRLAAIESRFEEARP